MSASNPKVLLFLGKGRSGSTVLDNVLGGVDGFFTAGELFLLWDALATGAYRCGCGELVPDCSLWRDVTDRVFDRRANGPADVGEARALQHSVLRWRHLPRVLLGRRASRRMPEAFRQWADLTGSLYRAIAEVTGARVIVDASKVPMNPAAAGLVAGIEPYLLHLVRDPRAVVYSWKRKKEVGAREGDEEMPRFGALYTSLSWTVRNAAVEVLRKQVTGPSHLVRYEDFAERPRDTVAEIVSYLEEDDAALPFVDARTAVVGGAHTVAGNPDRFDREEVTIREDVAWREALSVRDRRVTSLVAGPLLRRYRYPFRVRAVRER